MASDRQRFWWRVDRATRDLPIGGSVEITDAGMRAWIDSLPATRHDGGPRFRLYVEYLPWSCGSNSYVGHKI